MSNSPLVQYTRISPNRTSPRNHVIDTITIHCMAGQLSVETCGNVFAPTSRQASSNYGIGPDGRIGMYCPESDRSWCTSSAANDNRAITIEVASDPSHPYAVKDAAYESLIKLCADICKRNGIKKLVWSTDKYTRVNHLNGANMTVHRDYSAKSCPGDYLYNRHADIASKVNAIINASQNPSPPQPSSGNTSYVGKGIGSAIAKTAMVVRADSSISAAWIGEVPKGAGVEVLEVLKNGWYKIVWPGDPSGFGYTSNVNGAYYTYTPYKTTPSSGNTKYSGTGIGTATAKTDMSVRISNSTSARKIGEVKAGQKVEVLQVMSNGWYKIVWPGDPSGFGYTSNVSNAYYTYVRNK